MATATKDIVLKYYGDTSSNSVDYSKKFSLEVKTPTGTQPVHILIDWGDLLNLPIAKYNVLGLIKPFYSNSSAVSSTGSACQVDTSGIKLQSRSTIDNRYYAVEVDSAGRLYVNVP